MTEPLKPDYLEYNQLVDRIERGVTVVSGNLRLSHALQKSMEQKQLDNRLLVWETADILPWDAWVRRSYKEGLKTLDQSTPPILLSDTQERLLWERVITETEEGQALLQIPAAARHCAAAWRLQHEWQISAANIQHWHNEDSKVFLTWCDIFRSHCQKNHWVTMAQLPTVLGESIQASRMGCDNNIILTGFDELTPQQMALFESIRQPSCQIEWIEKKPIHSDVVTVRLDQARDEITSAARWARQILEKTPEARVGIVVPELSAHRTMIQGVFDRVLIPGSLDPGAHDIQRPYNISLGLPLIHSAVVETAMLLLRWQKGRWPLEALSVVLCSPYIGGWQQERFARALLDRKLREYGRQEIPLSLLSACAHDTTKPYYCPLFIAMLEAGREIVNSLPLEATAKDWTIHFATLLATFELGQGRPLSSEEYQTIEAWNDLLRGLAQLDNVSRWMDYSQAYRYLSQSTHERIFQPQTGDTPVQIMGMMEVIGLEFDYLWVMGMHDGVWPASPRPNQFLPVALQREKKLPHSSSTRELMVASHITQRLLGSAANVIFSYPGSVGDEPLRLSAILSGLTQTTLEQIPLWQEPLWDAVIYHAAAYETWRDMPVPVEDVTSVRGGSQIFKLQAACPFRAFAELRLGARPVDDATMGLAPSERGTLVHQVMEHFWSRVGDQKQLLDMDEPLLRKVIADCVRRAISSLEHKRGEAISERFQRLEQQRLEKLTHEWLMIEKQRQPFTVMQAEQKIKLEIEDMTINLKVDRVDELEGGARVVIDYKTGHVSPSQWFGERPEEPQLPLYSMTLPEHLVGLTFAQLKPGDSVFKGVTQEKNVLPGVRSYEQIPQAKKSEDWSALLAEWTATIKRLASEYRQGHAHVDPLRYPGSCQYCRLGQLCRINEQDSKRKDNEDEA